MRPANQLADSRQLRITSGSCPPVLGTFTFSLWFRICLRIDLEAAHRSAHVDLTKLHTERWRKQQWLRCWCSISSGSIAPNASRTERSNAVAFRAASQQCQCGLSLQTVSTALLLV
mmetsp:Transcript_107501/g.346895  ORF Transcript_107501/g.346895 Transcript_107501/m.346895 type:complete len:116 (+) Transcript_107501:227-574(+)